MSIDVAGQVTALVTGSGGFIGSHLVDALVGRGIPVRCLHRSSTLRAAGPNTQIVLADLRDSAAVQKAMEGVTLVFHLGGVSVAASSDNSPSDTFCINTLGTQNVLECARKAQARVVVLSTAHVYGRPSRLPVDETHGLAPASIYAATKAAADVMALGYYRSYGLPVTVLRSYNVYGPGQRNVAIIPTIVEQAIEGSPVNVRDLRPRRDFTYVSDVVEALLMASITPQATGKEFIICSGQAVSVATLVARIVTLAGGSPAVTAEESQESADCIYGDSTLARTVMGWKPQVDLDTGLMRTIDWWRTIKNT
jgi:nucleoside-diphosphate-sugar epimerase